jgi:transposase
MVAVVDGDGMVLGTESFSTTRAVYWALLRWMRGFGDLRRVGIEGTGSYAAGVTRHLADADVEVLEVDRPDRTDRRRRGKSDTFDAMCDAQAALAGRRTSIPKSRDGRIESLRVLKLTRATAIRARTKAGHSKLEIIRCLKRLLAREVYYLLRPAAIAQEAVRSQTSQLPSSSITSHPPQASAVNSLVEPSRD